MMNKVARKSIEERLRWLIKSGKKLVIDADTHITDISSVTGEIAEKLRSTREYFHGKPISADQLLVSMEDASIDASLCWQNPATTAYSSDPAENYRNLLAANTYVAKSAEAWPQKVIPSGWTDPRALGVSEAIRMARHCVLELGMTIVKLNPSQNGFMIDGEEVLSVVDAITELGAVPAFHFGADSQFTPADGLGRVAQRHPQHPLIAVHMGGGGAGYIEAETLYHEARSLGLRQANIHFIMSAKREAHIESDLLTYYHAGPPFSANLSFGSDAPYGLQSFCFGGYRALFKQLSERDGQSGIPADVESTFMGGNFARVAAESCRLVLDRNQ